jgi:hypothetical protein
MRLVLFIPYSDCKDTQKSKINKYFTEKKNPTEVAGGVGA